MQAKAPAPDCPLCPRPAAFREAARSSHPDWHNAPVPPFDPPGGPGAASVLVVGLAPGMGGANRTGRAFTGDYAGQVLYPALVRHGLARGAFAADPDDGLVLEGCRIVNAVRCVPPQNKPTGAEIATCRAFLKAEIEAMRFGLKVILTLGRIAHDSTLKALGLRLKDHPFRHHAVHGPENAPRIVSSYHTSRYNISTRVLTPEMFDAVVATVAGLAKG